MKAVRFDEYGGPEVLHLADVEDPQPARGEIRIAVRAAGVNGIDGKLRAGFLKEIRPVTLPSGTGVDAAGVVEQIGEGVVDVAVGDRVFGNGRDTLAEKAILTSWAPMPDELAFAEAAGYPVPAETATRILRLAAVGPGDTLLVSGASGGVGSAALQLARHAGVRVIGTASERNQDYLRSLGAVAITYGDGLVGRAREAAGGPIAAALDIAGSGVLPELIELTGDAARVVTIADFRGGEHGVRVSSAAQDYPGALALVADLARAGMFHIPVARAFTLDTAADAQASCTLGHVAGRIVVTV